MMSVGKRKESGCAFWDTCRTFRPIIPKWKVQHFIGESMRLHPGDKPTSGIVDYKWVKEHIDFWSILNIQLCLMRWNALQKTPILSVWHSENPHKYKESNYLFGVFLVSIFWLKMMLVSTKWKISRMSYCAQQFRMHVICYHWQHTKADDLFFFYINLHLKDFYKALHEMIFGHFYQPEKGHCPISCFYLFMFLTALKHCAILKPVQFHWSHLFDFSPLCVFKCLFKAFAQEDAKSHWLHLLNFSPLCIFKCLLKSLAWEDAKSHWPHL